MNARILGQGFEKRPFSVDMADAVVAFDAEYGVGMESIVIYSKGDDSVGVRIQLPRGTLSAVLADGVEPATCR